MIIRAGLLVLLLGMLAVSVDCGPLVRAKRAVAGPKWPMRKIAYQFSFEYDASARQQVENVLKQIEKMLEVDGEKCLEFAPRDAEKDYVLIRNIGNKECSSGIGYYPGINRVSLGYNCLEAGTIMHEIMHRLGFDHEHSRWDRDEHVEVYLNNTGDDDHHNNFEINQHSSRNMSQGVPYDFFSVTHYNSDALTKDRQQLTILTKMPALVNDKNEIFFERNTLSSLDILQLQRLYGCRTIAPPVIVKTKSFSDEEKIAKLRNRFKLETAFDGIDESVADKYTQRTFRTCGLSHFWPSEYPLIDDDHELYIHVCIPKRGYGERCRFSLECEDEEAVCIRPFFKRSGRCFNTENKKVNQYTQRINDKMFKTGKKIKDTVKSSISSIKKFFGKKSSDN